MKKTIVCVLALSFGVALSAPAGAMALHNLASIIDDNPDNDLCLAVAGGRKDRGAEIITWKCDHSLSQDWLPGVGNFVSFNTIESSVSRDNWVLGPKAGSLTPGTRIVDWTHIWEQNQWEQNQDWAWLFDITDRRGHGCYDMLNIASQLVLSVDVAQPTNGSHVILDNLAFSDAGQDFTGHAYQYWCIY